MGSYITAATDDDDDDVNVDEVGPAAMRRSRSHADVTGMYISTHSSTNSVDEEDDFSSYPSCASFRNRASGDDRRSCPTR